MANYKNNKPKTYRGCCKMCCLNDTDGRRNGRRHSLQEEKFYISADEEEYEECRPKEDILDAMDVANDAIHRRYDDAFNEALDVLLFTFDDEIE